MVRKAEAIVKLGENPSKQEEIDFFNAFVESIPRSSYLFDFFTRDLLSFVERNIRNDMYSNFDEYVENCCEGKLIDQRIEHERVMKEQKKKYHELEEELYKAQLELMKAGDRVRTAEYQVNQIKNLLK